jgi:hypothetical protein
VPHLVRQFFWLFNEDMWAWWGMISWGIINGLLALQYVVVIFRRNVGDGGRIEGIGLIK